MNKLSFSRPDSSVPGEIFQTLPDMKCHNWYKFKWPRLWSCRTLRFCQKCNGPYRLRVKKKQNSVDLEVSKSRKCISRLHRRRLKYLWKVSWGLIFTHTFLSMYFPVGRCVSRSPGSWIQSPVCPGGTKHSEWHPPSCRIGQTKSDLKLLRLSTWLLEG